MCGTARDPKQQQHVKHSREMARACMAASGNQGHLLKDVYTITTTNQTYKPKSIYKLKPHPPICQIKTEEGAGV